MLQILPKQALKLITKTKVFINDIEKVFLFIKVCV